MKLLSILAMGIMCVGAPGDAPTLPERYTAEGREDLANLYQKLDDNMEYVLIENHTQITHEESQKSICDMIREGIAPTPIQLTELKNKLKNYQIVMIGMPMGLAGIVGAAAGAGAGAMATVGAQVVTASLVTEGAGRLSHRITGYGGGLAADAAATRKQTLTTAMEFVSRAQYALDPSEFLRGTAQINANHQSAIEGGVWWAESFTQVEAAKRNIDSIIHLLTPAVPGDGA